MTDPVPSLVSRLIVGGLFVMFLLVLSVGIQLVGTLAVYAPGLFASWLVVGAFGVLGAAQVLRWWARRSNQTGSTVAMAFGAAGLACIAAAFPFMGLDESASPLYAYSMAFVVTATAALATWPGRPLQTFGGLWLLAIALMTTYWTAADDAMTGGLWTSLYFSSYLGTATFAVWVASGLIVISLSGSAGHREPAQGPGSPRDSSVRSQSNAES